MFHAVNGVNVYATLSQVVVLTPNKNTKRYFLTQMHMSYYLYKKKRRQIMNHMLK